MDTIGIICYNNIYLHITALVQREIIRGCENITSDETKDLIRKRRREENIKVKNQIPVAVVILIAALLIAALLWYCHQTYVVFWVIGILLGVTMRYSRFCFASAFRDPILIKNTAMARAMLLSLIVSSLGFAVIQHRYLTGNSSADFSNIPGMIIPAGINTAIGAFIFGIGMMLAGECASTVLVRIGEGHILPFAVLIGFFSGTTLGAQNYPFWYEKIIKYASAVYFPDYFDFGAVVIVQISVLVSLYWLASRFQKSRKGLRR